MSADERKESESLLASLSKDVLSAAVAKVCGLVDKAEFKRRQAPPIIRLHSKAFGFGRRIPIVKKNTKVV